MLATNYINDLEENEGIQKSLVDQLMEVFEDSENIDKVKSRDDFEDICESHIFSDEVIANLNYEERFDLCIYQENFTQKGCEKTSWGELENQINECAKEGIRQIFLVKMGIQLDDLENFMAENALDWDDLIVENTKSDQPNEVKNISNNGQLLRYKNSEDLYQFNFIFGTFKLPIYFS